MTLGAVYTLAEAAERLRMNRHGLAKVARRIGACAQLGRQLLFTDADLEAIWADLRVPKKPPRPETPRERGIAAHAQSFLAGKGRRK